MSLERALEIALILGFAVFFVFHAAAYAPYTVDDAFISFRYADNWSHGRGLVYNPPVIGNSGIGNRESAGRTSSPPVSQPSRFPSPGRSGSRFPSSRVPDPPAFPGERTEGYTNPLWVVILGAFLRLGANPVILAKVLNILLSLATLALVALLCRAASAKLWPAVVAAGLLATSDLFVENTIDGLETPLLTVLSLGALYCFWREWGRPGISGTRELGKSGIGTAIPDSRFPTSRHSRFPWSIVLATGAYLTRPDGALLAAALLVVGACLAWRSARPGRSGHQTATSPVGSK